MSLVGKEAPNFKGKVVMPDNSIKIVELVEFIKNKTGVLFFYPLDFTFVCPSEIITLNKKIKQFQERKTEVLLISVDSEFTHIAYKNTSVEKGGIGPINLPMVSDLNKSISSTYGVLDSSGVALRAVYIIDTTFTIRHQLINDLSIGRNIDEILRIIDAIAHHAKYGEVCPANWKEGSKGMKTSSIKDVADYFQQNPEFI